MKQNLSRTVLTRSHQLLSRWVPDSPLGV